MTVLKDLVQSSCSFRKASIHASGVLGSFKTADVNLLAQKDSHSIFYMEKQAIVALTRMLTRALT